jgi:hypothetical protein
MATTPDLSIPPVVEPVAVQRRPRQDQAMHVSEDNQRAAATWCAGAIGIHGVGVFVTSIDDTVPLGDWLVREEWEDRVTWHHYTDERMAELYLGPDEGGE